MSNNLKKAEIAKQQMILDSIVSCFNMQNAPILELSRKIDSLIIDYYNEMNKNIDNNEDTH